MPECIRCGLPKSSHHGRAADHEFFVDRCHGPRGGSCWDPPAWTLIDPAAATIGGCVEIAYACDQHLANACRDLGGTDASNGDLAVVVPRETP